MSQPIFMVRVSCATFNQVHYIVDALNGFTMQQTNFPFVCTIIDDASTDGEQEVIRQYLLDNFDMEDKPIVRNEETDDYVLTYAQHKTNKNCFFAVLYLKYNHYSIKKAKNPYIRDWMDVKYIAICEGDDYWTDPHKLQKQIDFLEAHPDCMMTFHRAKCRWEGKDTEQYTYDMDACEDRDYTSTELFENWIVPCASMVYRREVTDYPIRHRERFFSGDDVLYYSAAEMGKVHGFSDVMSVYRVHADSISRSKERENYRLNIYPDHYVNIYRNFPSINRKKLKLRIAVHLYHRMNITSSFYTRSIDWFRMTRWDFPYAYQYLKDRTNWYVLFPIRRKIKSFIIREK